MEYKFLGLLLLGFLQFPGALSKEEPKSPKQFGGALSNLQFAIPALGLLSSRSNLNIFALGGGKSTVTRTVVTTVATVTVPAFRTCTVTMAGLMPCAGRRRRSVPSPEASLQNPDIEPTPYVRISFGKTEITDPQAIAEILHVKDPNNIFGYDVPENDASDPTTTIQPLGESRSSLDNTTPSLDSSLADETIYPEQNDGLLVTTETPYLDEVTSFDEGVTEGSTDTSVDENEKGRLGVGGGNKDKSGGGSTVTSTISITAIASSFVTVAMSTLSITYGGCSPPQPFPVSTSMCP